MTTKTILKGSILGSATIAILLLSAFGPGIQAFAATFNGGSVQYNHVAGSGTQGQNASLCSLQVLTKDSISDGTLPTNTVRVNWTVLSHCTKSGFPEGTLNKVRMIVNGVTFDDTTGAGGGTTTQGSHDFTVNPLVNGQFVTIDVRTYYQY